MDIKNIYTSNLKYNYIVELADDKFYKFYDTPQREITKKDLKEVYSNTAHDVTLNYLHKLPIEETILKIYGLKKIK